MISDRLPILSGGPQKPNQMKQWYEVHPKNEQDPIFETQFDQPGRYKIWADFKQEGKVRVFSYVIEIK
jgi:hypothetical protein